MGASPRLNAKNTYSQLFTNRRGAAVNELSFKKKKTWGTSTVWGGALYDLTIYLFIYCAIQCHEPINKAYLFVQITSSFLSPLLFQECPPQTPPPESFTFGTPSTWDLTQALYFGNALNLGFFLKTQAPNLGNSSHVGALPRPCIFGNASTLGTLKLQF